MKISEVKREFQLQQWRGMVLERKESGLSVKEWCAERGITEHVYYYRLRQLRMSACQALQEAQPVQLAEVPLAPKVPERHASLRLTTRAGTLEIMDAVHGAKSSAIVYILVETAKANNLKIYEYLKHLLTVIPKHMDNTSLTFLEDHLP